jgi:hypothetical protein
MEVWDDVEKRECPKCKSLSQYSVNWDSKFCERCNIWLEKTDCKKPIDGTDPILVCALECWTRPEYPLQKIS